MSVGRGTERRGGRSSNAGSGRKEGREQYEAGRLFVEDGRHKKETFSVLNILDARSGRQL